MLSLVLFFLVKLDSLKSSWRLVIYKLDCNSLFLEMLLDTLDVLMGDPTWLVYRGWSLMLYNYFLYILSLYCLLNVLANNEFFCLYLSYDSNSFVFLNSLSIYTGGLSSNRSALIAVSTLLVFTNGTILSTGGYSKSGTGSILLSSIAYKSSFFLSSPSPHSAPSFLMLKS